MWGNLLKKVSKWNWLIVFDYPINSTVYLFDGGIVSYKEKLLKPEDGIYKKIIEEYKINPEESIFGILDDCPQGHKRYFMKKRI